MSSRYRVRFGKRASGALYRGTWVVEFYRWPLSAWRWGRTRRDTFDFYVGPFRFLRGSDRWEPGKGCGEFAYPWNVVMRRYENV